MPRHDALSPTALAAMLALLALPACESGSADSASDAEPAAGDGTMPAADAAAASGPDPDILGPLCEDDEGCAAGESCGYYSADPLHCMRLVGENERCGLSAACDDPEDRLVCLGRPGEARCGPRLAEGAECWHDWDCETGLACQTETGIAAHGFDEAQAGVCATLRAVGEGCVSSEQCAPTTRGAPALCNPLYDPPVCTDFTIGTRCDRDDSAPEPRMCEAPAYCQDRRNLPSICQSDRLGAVCERDEDCPAGVCRPTPGDGTRCQSEAVAGELCADDADCVADARCDATLHPPRCKWAD